MRMSVHETGMQQPTPRVDLGSSLGRSAAGRADLADCVAFDQYICRFGSAGGDIEHAPAAQDRIGHGIVSLEAQGMIRRTAPGADRCPVLSCNAAMPSSRS